MRVRGDSIQIDFRYQGIRCRETLRAKPTKANLLYAAAKRRTILDEIAMGVFDYAAHFPESPRCRLFGGVQQRKLTTGKALDQWLEGQRKHLAHATHDLYKKIIRKHLVPAFGDIPLSKLSTPMIRSLISHTDLSAKTINNILTPLRGMTADAFDDGLIARDPCARVHNLKVTTREPDPFTPAEITAVFSMLDGQALNYAQFCLWTGLRPSEAVAVEWQDIDLVGNTAHIRRAKVLKKTKTTKTVSGTRSIKLLPLAVEALTRQKVFTLLRGGEVFTDPKTGKAWVSDKAFRESHWKYALKRAGVRYRPPHQLRHTYASMMLSAGENPLWVAGQMGHANVAVMFKKYARWLPDVNPEAGCQMVTKWSQATGAVEASD